MWRVHGEWASWRCRSRLLFLSISLALTPVAPLLADEPVPIAEILADPDSYHLRLVTLHGVVREVKTIEPYSLPSGAFCYGAYSFVLGDHTGAVEVTVLGLCGTPISRPPDVLVGDEVVVEAGIHAPGHTGTLYGPNLRMIPRPPPTTVQAIARNIWPAVKPVSPER